jgi:GWxTD domain-containing protein
MKIRISNKAVSILLIATITVSLLILNGCGQSKRLIRDLPEDDRDFLSDVRYIITRHEKKRFLSLTSDRERREFRVQFWKKRDPDPTTEQNEFKEEYYNRMDQANHLFSRGSAPGWLTDRGRVYVILGPPETKRVYPTGYNFYDSPAEVWFYGFFPIVFIDWTYSGDYRLTPLGARYVAEINKAQIRETPQVKKEKTPFAFQLKLVKHKKNKQHYLRIVIPYRNIVFQEGPDGYISSLVVHVTVVETKKNISQTLDKPFVIKVKEADLDVLKKDYIMDIPVKLDPGKYEVTAVLESETDKIKIRDRITFGI